MRPVFIVMDVGLALLNGIMAVIGTNTYVRVFNAVVAVFCLVVAGLLAFNPTLRKR